MPIIWVLYSTIPDLMAYLPFGVAVAASDLLSVALAFSEVLLLQEKSTTIPVIIMREKIPVVFILGNCLKVYQMYQALSNGYQEYDQSFQLRYDY
jgi:hypothetical protein